MKLTDLKMPKNERQLPRVDGRLAFAVVGGGRGDVLDVSAAGFRGEATWRLEVGSLVEVELTPPVGPLVRVSCKVVWSQPDDLGHVRMGFQLLRTTGSYLRLVAELFADSN
jgi:hypothetical protein